MGRAVRAGALPPSCGFPRDISGEKNEAALSLTAERPLHNVAFEQGAFHEQPMAR